MQKFNGYDEAKKQAQYTGATQLPVGAYVAKVLDVRFRTFDSGRQQIVVAFDIEEGECKGFFKKQFDENQQEDKKWKGTAGIYVPTDDGSEQDGWTKNAFAKWTDSLEKSNDGYVWDWDENKWKNKLIGLVFRKTGTVIEGKEVTYTEVAFPVDVKTVRDGKAPEAKFKAKNGYTGNQQTAPAIQTDEQGFMKIPDGVAEQLPF